MFQPTKTGTSIPAPAKPQGMAIHTIYFTFIQEGTVFFIHVNSKKRKQVGWGDLGISTRSHRVTDWLFDQLESWLIDWLIDVSISSTDSKLDFSLISSDDEGNDDEDVSFSEPPLDDEDDEPLTRPSSGFTPSPQPLTSTQKPRERNSDGEKASEKKGQGRLILKFRFHFCNLC